jgi:hypothetical protein
MKTQKEINEKIQHYEKEMDNLWERIIDYNNSKSIYSFNIETMRCSEQLKSYIKILKWVLE